MLYINDRLPYVKCASIFRVSCDVITLVLSMTESFYRWEEKIYFRWKALNILKLILYSLQA